MLWHIVESREYLPWQVDETSNSQCAIQLYMQCIQQLNRRRAKDKAIFRLSIPPKIRGKKSYGSYNGRYLSGWEPSLCQTEQLWRQKTKPTHFSDVVKIKVVQTITTVVSVIFVRSIPVLLMYLPNKRNISPKKSSFIPARTPQFETQEKNPLKMKASKWVSSRGLFICERLHPQDDNLNCAGQHEKKIATVWKEEVEKIKKVRVKQNFLKHSASLSSSCSSIKPPKKPTRI